ncbi:S9 family peptidase [Streptomyces sp. AD681]|uniref:S9 family peptidase n=1 Tax=Streptomyces sp. AD681 TaxID=3019069 RepID=UPI0022F1D746|nr:S9 family peptidase [Streptomyces sp. AD681]MDA5147034.1 S9 family peptidase [Streptomyces sp. AD681]
MSTATDGRRNIDADDLTALALAGAPDMAPDGTWAVASVQRADPSLARYRRRLWRFDTAGDCAPRPLTPDEGAWSDTAPVISPDGGLVAFRSDRDGVTRVWLVPALGGTPVPLKTPEHADGTPSGQPAEHVWLDPEHLLVRCTRRPEEAASRTAPTVVNWLNYMADGEPRPVEPLDTLWILRTGPGDTAFDARLVLDGGAGQRLAALTPDGRGGVFHTAHPRHSDTVHPGGEVRRLDLATGEDVRVWRCPSRVRALAVTASGRPVALASGQAGHSVEPPRVWLADEGRQVFPGQDLECERALLADSRALGGPRLLATAGERILFLATMEGEVALYEGRTDGEARRVSPRGRSVADFAVAPGGSAALCLESATEPVELYLSGRRVSRFNTDWAARARPVAAEDLTAVSADGLTVHGRLYRSPHARPGSGDVLLRVHGGPHMVYGNAFDLETQALVAAGFHVLLPEVRGGAGRGTAFRALSVGNWGRGDLDDVLAFADLAVACGLAAPDRLYLAGGSYGGYLTNWTLTRTGRFRAAVSERSLANLVSKSGTSDNGFTVNRYEFGGADIYDPKGVAELWERSPLAHAAAVTTPLLLIHGESDRRCPVEQAEQFYTALRRRGHEVVFARYPDASHGFATSGRPDHRLHRLRLLLDWLRTHAAREGRTDPPPPPTV